MNEPDFDTTPSVNEDDAKVLAASLDERLKAPIQALLDGLVRELSDAHNQLMQSPRGAGEPDSNKYLIALHHVMTARSHVRGH